jgi:ring-1,2-phenylacetyl-CoA epoxidase subunit PaaB
MSTDPKSLDPRMNRIPLQDAAGFTPEPDMDHWQTYEVFHQKSRGDQHVHVGIVHAPNADMAILFAKEQYARRMKCVNLWVVRTADVIATEYEDEDMFMPGVDKGYREAYFYKTRDVIEDYKRSQAPPAPVAAPADPNAPKNKPRIILGKKK